MVALVSMTDEEIGHATTNATVNTVEYTSDLMLHLLVITFGVLSTVNDPETLKLF